MTRKTLQNASLTLDPSHLFSHLPHFAQIIGLIFLTLLNFSITFTSTCFVCFLFHESNNHFHDDTTSQNPVDVPSSNPEHPTISINPAPFVPEFIDLQPTVDQWLSTVPNVDIGLMIYDLDNDRIAASHQADKTFSVASIYKLFYVYDGYAQISANNIDIEAPYLTTKDYRARTYTFPECLDLMIRESYNGCADFMHDNPIISSRVEELIEQLDLASTSNYGLRSSAHDLTILLKHFVEHPDFNEQLYNNFLDSMLNQPPTQVAPDVVNDWRQGLPSGFPESVLVYDKVGWEWDGKKWKIFADAAIVEFPEQERHYIMVVLTSGITDPKTQQLRNLGSLLSEEIINRS